MEEKLYWNLAFTKIFSIALKKNDIEFPDFLQSSFQTTEEMKDSFNQKWLDVFSEIKEKASVEKLIQLCHLMKNPENYAKFHSDVNNLIPAIHPIMWVYLHFLLVHS